MAGKPNLLFIMCDQLRADYLGCYGHPTLSTPHIDALAANGVMFTRAYCQSPICGPSRMSFYTGRYMFSHGSTWNNFQLPVHEMTMGDYLRPLGYRVALIGKTHMAADRAAMRRLRLDPGSDLGILLSQCGFEPFERDDGLHPDSIADPDLAYNRYLNRHGYPGDNPWHDYANSAQGSDGEILSGWRLRYARLPARVAEPHSETAYMTQRAIDFIESAGETPWCAHLSYIKPHWPYMAPAPYHALYSAADVVPANRSEQERDEAHPVVAAFRRHPDSKIFSRDQTRETVIPTYMGLIKQIDDHVGKLIAYLRRTDRLGNTLIVFSSDHGDFLGDHWLGEKELCYEEAARIPLIVCDPSNAADANRGRRDDRLVEAIDVLPTFIAAAADEAYSQAHAHRLEGRSLLPLVRASPAQWREAAFSETDYSMRQARLTLALAPHQARAFMVRSEAWKYVFYERFRPQLFDLDNDPKEQHDLGDAPDYASVRAELHERLFEWLRQRRTRVTVSDQRIAETTDTSQQRGFLIGVW